MENKPKDWNHDLFPLLMSSIEKFHWYDSRPSHPNFIFGRLEFKNQINPVLAEEAWRLALERQPFAGIKPQKVKGHWYWVADVDAGASEAQSRKGSFHYLETDASPEPWNFGDDESRLTTSGHLEIRAGGFKMRAADFSGESVEAKTLVYFAVHHAICDGAGAVLVINEWLVIYSNLAAKRVAIDGLQRLETERLKTRNHLGVLRWSYWKHLLKQPVALFGAAKFIFRKSVNLTDHRDVPDGVAERYPAIVGRWVDTGAVRDLDQESRRLGVTLNSIMLGRLFSSLSKFLVEGAAGHEKDWLRVILPISIRGMADRRLPAANRTTIVQLDRRTDELALSDSFYQNLDREVRIIRGWQLDKMFLISIRLLSMFDPLLRKAARNRKSRGTVVFTNLGEPFRQQLKSKIALGREAIDQFDLVGPVREGTPLNYTVARHGDQLRVSLHYDAGVFSGKRADELLESYVNELQSGASREN